MYYLSNIPRVHLYRIRMFPSPNLDTGCCSIDPVAVVITFQSLCHFFLSCNIPVHFGLLLIYPKNLLACLGPPFFHLVHKLRHNDYPDWFKFSQSLRDYRHNHRPGDRGPHSGSFLSFEGTPRDRLREARKSRAVWSVKGNLLNELDQLMNSVHTGDGLILTPNGHQVLRDLDDTGSIGEWVKKWSYNCTNCKVYDTNGVHVGQHPIPDTDKGLSLVPRGGLVHTLYQTAKRLGLDLRLGVKVTEFRENETEASVVVDGIETVGDCIIFADGANSRGRAVVSTRNTRPYYSGFSAYRGKADGTALIDDPQCHWLLNKDSKNDSATAFAGPNMYVLLATCGKGRASFCIGITQVNFVTPLTSNVNPPLTKPTF